MLRPDDRDRQRLGLIIAMGILCSLHKFPLTAPPPLAFSASMMYRGSFKNAAISGRSFNAIYWNIDT